MNPHSYSLKNEDIRTEWARKLGQVSTKQYAKSEQTRTIFKKF